MTIVRDPIPVQPFLDWFDKRAAILKTEYDHDDHGDGLVYALDEIGWDRENGSRRIYRWRHESATGMVTRADVEDALHRAGVLFHDVYPDLADGFDDAVNHHYRPRSRISETEVLAAHTIYMRTDKSLVQIGDMLKARYGYTTGKACANALTRAFRYLGLQPHPYCKGTRTNGQPCRRWPGADTAYCSAHDPQRPVASIEIAKEAGLRLRLDASISLYRFSSGRRHLTPDLMRQITTMHVDWGMSINAIAKQLIPQTELTNIDSFHKLISDELKRRGLFYIDRPAPGRRSRQTTSQEQAA